MHACTCAQCDLHVCAYMSMHVYMHVYMHVGGACGWVGRGWGAAWGVGGVCRGGACGWGACVRGHSLCGGKGLVAQVDGAWAELVGGVGGSTRSVKWSRALDKRVRGGRCGGGGMVVASERHYFWLLARWVHSALGGWGGSRSCWSAHWAENTPKSLHAIKISTHFWQAKGRLRRPWALAIAFSESEIAPLARAYFATKR